MVLAVVLTVILAFVYGEYRCATRRGTSHSVQQISLCTANLSEVLAVVLGESRRGISVVLAMVLAVVFSESRHGIGVVHVKSRRGTHRCSRRILSWYSPLCTANLAEVLAVVHGESCRGTRRCARRILPWYCCCARRISPWYSPLCSANLAEVLAVVNGESRCGIIRPAAYGRQHMAGNIWPVLPLCTANLAVVLAVVFGESRRGVVNGEFRCGIIWLAAYGRQHMAGNIWPATYGRQQGKSCRGTRRCARRISPW